MLVAVYVIFLLNRTVFSFVSGIYVYMVAWGLFGQNSGDNLGPKSLPCFAVCIFVISYSYLGVSKDK